MAIENRIQYESQNQPFERNPARIQIPKSSVAGMIWFEKSLKKTIALYLLMNALILFFSSDYYVEVP